MRYLIAICVLPFLQLPAEAEEQCDYGTDRCLFAHNPEETNSSSDRDLLQQCALDLCGPPIQRIQLTYSYPDLDIEQMVQPDLLRKWEEEFQALGVRKIIEQWVNEEMKLLDHLQKVFKNSSLSRKSGFDYLKPDDYVLLSHTFFKKDIQLNADGTPLLCQNGDCRQAVEEIITELFSSYRKPFPRKDRVDYVSAQCLSEFVMLKQLERELLEGLDIPDLKRNFLHKVLENFSPETGKSFEDYINNDFYIGPPLPMTQDFASLLEDRARYIGRPPIVETEKEPPIGRKESTDNLRKRSTVDLITDMYWERQFFLKQEDIIPLCGSDHHSEPVDRFMPSNSLFLWGLPRQFKLEKGAISLSLFSFLHPHSGRGIAAHELGHLLSWMFVQNKLSRRSYMSYKNLRECANKRYKHLNILSKTKHHELLHENDKLYTEEDTADLISYLVVRDRKTHYSCSLLDITEDGTQYYNLDILPNDDADYGSKMPHSTSLLRLLFEAIHKRVELSTACQQVVDQYKNEINFEPCF